MDHAAPEKPGPDRLLHVEIARAGDMSQILGLERFCHTVLESLHLSYNAALIGVQATGRGSAPGHDLFCQNFEFNLESGRE